MGLAPLDSEMLQCWEASGTLRGASESWDMAALEGIGVVETNICWSTSPGPYRWKVSLLGPVPFWHVKSDPV